MKRCNMLALVFALSLTTTGLAQAAAQKVTTKSSARTTTVSVRDVTPDSTKPLDDHSQIIAGPGLAFGSGVTLFGIVGEFVAPVGPRGLMLGMQSGFYAGSYGYYGYGGSYGAIPLLATAIYRLNASATLRPWIGASLGPVVGFAGGASGVGFGGNIKGGLTINRWNVGAAVNFSDGGANFGINGGYVFNL